MITHLTLIHIYAHKVTVNVRSKLSRQTVREQQKHAVTHDTCAQQVNEISRFAGRATAP